MSYDANVFNVMIASPADVASERSIIREMIYEWNAVHSRARQIVLLPVGWESHSSPEMGKRPQEIINDQILYKCDLLVGVFWTRIGTSTGKYASGTVEEIEKHIDAGKPTMLYFSEQPARPDSVDSEQYEKLKAFKESCKNRGLYETYDSYAEFKEKFYHHLQIKMNQNGFFFSGGAESFSEVIYQSETQIPALGHEARILLKEASMDSHGTILCVDTFDGTDIQTNGRNLIPEQNPRTVAQWKSALKELHTSDLVEEIGHKGEIFQVTSSGYKVADMIEV